MVVKGNGFSISSFVIYAVVSRDLHSGSDLVFVSADHQSKPEGPGMIIHSLFFFLASLGSKISWETLILAVCDPDLGG